MFWPLLWILGSFILSIYIVNTILRNKYNIQKRDWTDFDNNHVNGTHRKISFFMFIITALVFIIVVYLRFPKDPTYIFFGFAIVTLLLNETLKVYMEWKHRRQEKHYILDASNLVLSLIFTVIFYVYAISNFPSPY
ncbi:hypothetical protein CEY16_07070 [Halalkalibacillus sediminis]|uniref:DUF4181 domain-containing protein n=1 Tax=Halalkalibacillus sediminis TaxID=2018042 RepID=A0A2I0QTL6_9BACI|nr:DUF4181 domain-containing protein [Halalkalibacillus sediminis]PKR77687.1 hypothetical protein CEY16_07070 [Halalkalibacillus sediminis]